jgi:RNA polymerase sigma-70 factor (ECF subfamily)
MQIRKIIAESMADRSLLRAVEGGPVATPEPEISDEGVIAGLCAGHDWAADMLYDRVQPAVDRTLRRILQGSDGDYEDLVQITLERIIRTLLERRFAGACSLTTWASAIASHVGIDAVRGRIRDRTLFGNADNSGSTLVPGPSLERQIEARSEVGLLHATLAAMDARQAETVVLHDLFGHELSEIAVLMGVSVAAAQSRLVRGRKELLRRAGARLGGT